MSRDNGQGDKTEEAVPTPETMIPQDRGPAVVSSEDFADMIMASLKLEGVDFERAMRILFKVGSFCVQEPTERRAALDAALGTWRTREAKGGS